MTILFDIETGPLSDAELAAVEPKFKPPGNYKKPEAIAEWMAEARKEWVAGAALSAITGRVLAIGYGRNDNGTRDVHLSIEDDEAAMIRGFWRNYQGATKIGDAWETDGRTRWVGFNIFGFDLPFLIRRSWKLNVPIPEGLRIRGWWSDRWLDLMDLWQLGDRRGYVSLDSVARHLGVGQKSGNGADFAKTLKEDPQAARVYLSNDIQLTMGVHDRLCPF
jgi:predicted PolB exonuclease-like 3'-5' exonuclease